MFVRCLKIVSFASIGVRSTNDWHENAPANNQPVHILHLFSTTLTHLTMSAQGTYADKKTGKFIKF